MTDVDPFYSARSDPSGERKVFHDQFECGFGKEVIRNNHHVPYTGNDREPCTRCVDIAAGK